MKLSLPKTISGYLKPALVAWIGCGVLLMLELSVWILRSSEPARWKSTPTLQLTIPEIPASVVTSHASTNPVEVVYRFHEQPDRLTGAVEDQLAFSHGLCGAFLPQGNLTSKTPILELFYLEYAAGNPRFIHDVYGHAPEVCMRATGAILQGSHPDRGIEVDGVSLPVRVIEFKTPQAFEPLWMFKLTWVPEEAPYQPDGIESSLRREKIQAGLSSSPRPPARVILVGARNFPDVDSAWKAYHRLVVESLSMEVPMMAKEG